MCIFIHLQKLFTFIAFIVADAAEMLSVSHHSIEYDIGVVFTPQESHNFRVYYVYMRLDPIYQYYTRQYYWDWQTLSESETSYVSHLAEPLCRNHGISLLSTWLDTNGSFSNLLFVQVDYALMFGDNLDNRDVYCSAFEYDNFY